MRPLGLQDSTSNVYLALSLYGEKTTEAPEKKYIILNFKQENTRFAVVEKISTLTYIFRYIGAIFGLCKKPYSTSDILNARDHPFIINDLEEDAKSLYPKAVKGRELLRKALNLPDSHTKTKRDLQDEATDTRLVAEIITILSKEENFDTQASRSPKYYYV